MKMNKAFEVQFLNEVGRAKAIAIAHAFDKLVDELEEIGCAPGRELALTMTSLEQACFFAKKAMANVVGHQEQPRTFEVLAQDMFNAYNECSPNPWKTFDGRPVPRWPDLTDQVREKWIAAAKVSAGE